MDAERGPFLDGLRVDIEVGKLLGDCRTPGSLAAAALTRRRGVLRVDIIFITAIERDP